MRRGSREKGCSILAADEPNPVYILMRHCSFNMGMHLRVGLNLLYLTASGKWTAIPETLSMALLYSYMKCNSGVILDCYSLLLGFWTLSIVRIVEIRTMDKVQKPSSNKCYIPSSEPFRMY
jgi:hypothetical protein